MAPAAGYTGGVASAAETAASSECRECCSFCDRLIHPSGCLEAGCRFVYVYDDERSGRRYMGCMNKVFKVEVDMKLLEDAERTRHGFGGVKMVGNPLPQCRTSVEKAYYGDGEAFDCVNPRFFDPPRAEAGVEPAFDLRDRL